MEFEKLKKIIVDVLNVDENEITMDPWMYSRSLWDLRKNLISRFQTSRQKRLLQ